MNHNTNNLLAFSAGISCVRSTKAAFAFFSLICITAVGFAQSHHVTRTVELEFQACYTSYNSGHYADLTVADGSSSVGNVYFGPFSYTCKTGSDLIEMKPGVEYQVIFDTYGTYGEKVTMTSPHGWVFQVSESGGSELVERKAYSGTTDFTIKLVPGQVTSPAGAEEPVVPAGLAGSLAHEGVMWSVGLGSLINGRSAGTLQLRYDTLAELTYEPADIQFSVNSPEIDFYAPSGNLRQIFAPQALVDVYDTGTDKYELRFYDWTQVTGKSGNLYSFTGSAFVTYEIAKNGSDLRVKKISGTQTWYTRLTYSSCINRDRLIIT